MSGAPAFQSTASQPNAFQSGVQVVAGNYFLGSPAFATPILGSKYVFHAAAYSLASPSFATPTLATASGIAQLHANPYSVGSPSFAIPSLRIYKIFAVNAYSLGSPAFAFPAFHQNHHIFTNSMSLSGLSFTTPQLLKNYQLTASAAYWLASPDIHSDIVIEVNRTLTAQAFGYTLDHPRFGFPRLTVTIIQAPWPRTYFSQAEEAGAMLGNLLNYILMSLPPVQTDARDLCRRLCTTLRDNASAAIRGNTLGTQLQAIYNAADAAGASYGGIEAARQYLMSQVASTSAFTQIVFRSALVMTLAEESMIISRFPFATQAEVQNMIYHVRDMFDAAKALGIDEVDIVLYQTLNALGGAVMNHLATTELKLPRFMAYQTGMPMPSLYLAQRIYADPSRSDELEAENGVIHPAFMPRTLRVLSAPPVGPAL
jgi:hypothetical protein